MTGLPGRHRRPDSDSVFSALFIGANMLGLGLLALIAASPQPHTLPQALPALSVDDLPLPEDTP